MTSKDEKIERIQKATIELIATHGLAYTSVANIAKLADVSVGYLYRHFSGKEELVNRVLSDSFKMINTIIEEMLRSSGTIDEYIEKFSEMVYRLSVEQPYFFRFLITIQNDYSHTIEMDIIGKVRELCGQILERCQTGNYRADLTVKDVYIIFIVLPQQYIAQSFRKNMMDDQPKEQTITSVMKMILGAITINIK